MVNLGIRIVDDSFCSVVDMNVYSFFLRAVGCPKYGGSRGPDGVPTTIVVVEANRAVGFCEDLAWGYWSCNGFKGIDTIAVLLHVLSRPQFAQKCLRCCRRCNVDFGDVRVAKEFRLVAIEGRNSVKVAVYNLLHARVRS